MIVPPKLLQSPNIVILYALYFEQLHFTTCVLDEWQKMYTWSDRVFGGSDLGLHYLPSPVRSVRLHIV